MKIRYLKWEVNMGGVEAWKEVRKNILWIFFIRGAWKRKEKEWKIIQFVCEGVKNNINELWVTGFCDVFLIT